MIKKTVSFGILSALLILAANSQVQAQAGGYQDAVISLAPTYYYQLNETDTSLGVIDTMGNAAPGTYNGDYVNGPPQVGVPGPDSVGSMANVSGFYPLVDLPGLGSGNLAHASNNAGHINLGPQDAFGSNSITVAMFVRGGGSADGGDRLFTNNLTDPLRSFQIVVGNNGLVIAVDPSLTGLFSERTVYLPDSSDHDTNIISPDNGWFHVVASTEGTTGIDRAANIRVWINGVDRTDNLVDDSTGWGTDTNLAKLGGRREAATDSTTHSGMQDELSIWLDRVLTDAEVAQLWTAATTEPEPNGILGDANGDENFDFGDIEAFFLALTDPTAYAVQYPGVAISLLDMNDDGNTDFGDIDAFFTALTGG